MKALKISTALSLLLLTAAAPGAWSVGDPNIDSGVGSAASRGPFGFSNNNDPIYDDPPNSYGVYRDASGGFRDSGMLPDNLTTKVHEPTWAESRRMRSGPMPGGGAPGGLAGGGFAGGGLAGGGFLGGGLLGGIGGGALGGGLLGGGGFGGSPFPFSVAGAFPVGFNGGVSLGVTGSGPFSQAARTPYGFAGTPGTYFPYPAYTQQRYLSGGGFIPSTTSTSTRTVSPDGAVTHTVFGDNSGVPFSSQMTTSGAPTTSTTSGDTTSTTSGDTTTTSANPQYTNTTMSYNGNEISTTSIQAPVNGGTSTTSSNGSSTSNNSSTTATQPDNTTIQTFSTSSGNRNPFVPNTANTISDYTDRGSTGSIGGGFATPQTSGHQNSVFFTDNQSTGMSGGFATPQSSGHASAVYHSSSLNSGGGLGGSFSTPATSGSERSAIFSNPNNRFGGAGAGGGISAGFGNRAYWGSDTEETQDRADGTIGKPGGGASLRMENSNGGTGGGTMGTGGTELQPMISRLPSLRGNGSALSINSTAAAGAQGRSALIGRSSGGGSFISAVPSVIVPGPNADNSDGTYGFFGGAQAMAEATRAGLASDIPFMGGGVRSPMSVYSQSRALRDRRVAQGGFSAGEGPIGNLTTDMEQKLAALNLTPRQALGRVIGSTRFENGDIITYGTKGTLRLSADNSGSITFNSGEIVTFTKVAPDLRSIALRSTLIF